MSSSELVTTSNRTCTRPASRSVTAGGPPRYGTCKQVDAGHHLEQFAGHMTGRAVAGRRHGDFARIGLGVSDEFRNCLGREFGVDHDDIGQTRGARDRRDVANEIVVERRPVQCRVDDVRRADRQQRIAVGGRTHDGLGGDIARGAGPILDDDRLTETLLQPLPDHAGEKVRRAAGRKADQNADRPRRIGVRKRRARGQPITQP